MGTKQNEKGVKACFACTTPYQLMGAISIAQSKDIKGDLYVFGMFSGYDEIAERIKDYNIFREVIPVDCSRFRSLPTSRYLFHMFNYHREVLYFLPSHISYDIMYISSRAHVKLLMRHELEHRNPKMRYVMFEDGLGTYSADSHVLNSSKLRRIIEKILGWDTFKPGLTVMMATHPELVTLSKKMSGISIEKMPSFRWSSENRKMLLDIFSVNNMNFINERVILFDVTRGTYKEDLGVNVGLLDKCYQLMSNNFGYDSVVCKPHPRSKTKTEASVKEYQQKGVPIEILYASMDDLDSRILVGTFSTALFTPKMMFDKEPIVICLYKMVWPGNHELPPLYEKLCNMYQHRERIIAPKNIEELKVFLARTR